LILKTKNPEVIAAAQRLANLKLTSEERWLNAYALAARAHSLPDMEFPHKIRSLLFHLHQQEAAYMIIGGYAVVHHGHLRYTDDLDIWAQPTPENGARVLAALQAAGYDITGLVADDFGDPSNFFHNDQAPNSVHILLRALANEFDVCFAERDIIRIKGLPVSVISIERLIQEKEAASHVRKGAKGALDASDAEELRLIEALKRQRPDQ
jgi:hypothetical protein